MDMKYWLILSVILIAVPVRSFASDMQGACSSHSGVNYSLSFLLSPTTDGNVYCEDGFHSSVPFVPQYPICDTWCCNSSDINKVNIKDSSIAQYSPGIYSSDMASCKNQINDYQNKLNSYNQEVQNIQIASDNAFRQKIQEAKQKVQDDLDFQKWIKEQQINSIKSTTTPVTAPKPFIGLQMPTKKVQSKKIIIKKK